MLSTLERLSLLRQDLRLRFSAISNPVEGPWHSIEKLLKHSVVIDWEKLIPSRQKVHVGVLKNSFYWVVLGCWPKKERMHGTFGRNVTFFCFSYDISSWMKTAPLKAMSFMNLLNIKLPRLHPWPLSRRITTSSFPCACKVSIIPGLGLL